MEILKKKRKSLRAAVTRLINDTNEELQRLTGAEDLNVQLERMTLLQTQLKDVDEAIEPYLEEEDAEAEFDQAYEYADRLVTTITKLRFRTRQLTERGDQQTTANAGASLPTAGTPATRVKLPTLELVKFNGQQRSWLPFWEQFETAIHQNPHLSTADKFNYLRSALTGDGAAVIAGLHPAATCYDEALDLLLSRFGNQAALIQDHMECLMDLRPVPSSGNVRALRRLYDSVQAHIRGLKALGVEGSSYCSMLQPLLLRVLPNDMVLQYNKKMLETADTNKPNGSTTDTNSEATATTLGGVSSQEKALRSLLLFLKIEVESREKSVGGSNGDSTTEPPGRIYGRERQSWRFPKTQKQRDSSAAALHGVVKESECVFCRSRRHRSEDCDASIALAEKKKTLQAQKRCFRCTKANHLSRQCKSRVTCGKCHGRHVTALCDPDFVRKREAKPPNNESSEETTPKAPINLHTSGNDAIKTTVLLQTVAAWGEGRKRPRLTRVLMDSGSQRSFITEELSKRLDCRLVGTEILTVGVFGGKRKEQTYRRIQLTLRSRHNDKRYVIDALETPTICEQTVPSPDENARAALKEIGCLVGEADAEIDDVGIGVLLGSDHYWECVTGKIQRLSERLVAVETVFGWAVHGRAATTSMDVSCTQALVFRTTAHDSETAPILRKFWELESLGIMDPANEDSPDDVTRLHFEERIRKLNDRYEVSLPWKSDVRLADNMDVARKRLGGLAKKLGKNPVLMQDYDQAIRKYQQDGIAERVTTEMEGERSQHVYYMPHQAVIREGNVSTRLRVVFDASSHEANAKSLNDNLESGPSLNPDLVALLLRFREHPVAIVADVEKAFLQIGVCPEDRDALRFFWFKDRPEAGQPLPEVETWRMTRVTFGTTSSPFLLAATLQHHLKEMENAYPATAEKLRKSMYVDDLLTGAECEEEALRFCSEAKEIFQAASMRLHKWSSNSTRLNAHFQRGTTSAKPGGVTNVLKVLGLAWDSDQDNLTFSPDHVINFAQHQTNTKRSVLQTTARLYDPLGFVAPFVVRAKLLFQEIWKQGLNWDDELPAGLLAEWKRWCEELKELGRIHVPRFYGRELLGKATRVSLHVFADASTLAYGALIYLCATGDDGATTTTLLLAKSRVTPLKPITLARLELMAGLVASRLYQCVKENLEVHVNEVHFWTDSMITLHWIQGDADRWKPFVKNRVTEVQRNCQGATWHHCPGKDNPADLLTRGIPASRLVSSELWWKGPSWLASQRTEWPNEGRASRFTAEELEERREVEVLKITTSPTPALLDMTTFSSVTRLHRTTAWILRFVHNTRSDEKRQGSLSAEEVQAARCYWIKNSQASTFSEEIRAVSGNTRAPGNSPLRDFTTFLDRDGVLRIQGRITSSNLSRNERQPIVLSKEHHYSTLLVRQAHIQLLHAGVRDTLVQLRETYWILRGRQLVKKCVRACVTCQRYSATPVAATTGPLPPERTSQADPFEIVGVDFAGPLLLKDNEGTCKSYLVLFTCAVTRAVHLELVPDMSAGQFLLAFRRFVSRRGICRVVYSDNAMTFKRASKELAELWRALRHPLVLDHFANANVEWKFIVERAPWWGGFYERMVRSVKQALKKVIGRKCVDSAELTTILAEIEAVVNSRPLTFLYSELDEGDPLTPASFLTGKRLTSLPVAEVNFSGSSQHVLRDLWRRRKSLLNRFWQRWNAEYLRELRSAFASKQKQSPPVKVGDFVMLKENVPRLLWKVARVERVFRGRDGKVRSCEIRLPRGLFLKRPVQLLYPLEIDNV